MIMPSCSQLETLVSSSGDKQKKGLSFWFLMPFTNSYWMYPLMHRSNSFWEVFDKHVTFRLDVIIKFSKSLPESAISSLKFPLFWSSWSCLNKKSSSRCSLNEIPCRLWCCNARMTLSSMRFSEFLWFFTNPHIII